MTESNVDLQREKFAGKYVAWRDEAVVASANSYDELCEELESARIDRRQLIVEFLDRSDTIRVY